MKVGLLIIGALILLASYFILPGLTTVTYVIYGGYIIGALLVLAGLFGKKRF